jgi:hypothetical protein
VRLSDGPSHFRVPDGPVRGHQKWERDYLTSSPVTARPISIRWISDVPSKIVKILAVRAVSAGQRPADPRAISTDPARPVRDECRLRIGPCRLSIVVRTHAEQLLPPRRPRSRQDSPQVHRRYISTLTCKDSTAGTFVRADSRTRAGRPGRQGNPLLRFGGRVLWCVGRGARV